MQMGTFQSATTVISSSGLITSLAAIYFSALHLSNRQCVHYKWWIHVYVHVQANKTIIYQLMCICEHAQYNQLHVTSGDVVKSTQIQCTIESVDSIGRDGPDTPYT